MEAVWDMGEVEDVEEYKETKVWTSRRTVNLAQTVYTGSGSGSEALMMSDR